MNFGVYFSVYSYQVTNLASYGFSYYPGDFLVSWILPNLIGCEIAMEAGYYSVDSADSNQSIFWSLKTFRKVNESEQDRISCNFHGLSLHR